MVQSINHYIGFPGIKNLTVIVLDYVKLLALPHIQIPLICEISQTLEFFDPYRGYNGPYIDNVAKA